jgi:hypothetical protein
VTAFEVVGTGVLEEGTGAQQMPDGEQHRMSDRRPRRRAMRA